MNILDVALACLVCIGIAICLVLGACLITIFYVLIKTFYMECKQRETDRKVAQKMAFCRWFKKNG